MQPSRDRVLGVFAKWPVPGHAKTRLAQGGPDWGARVARAFLLDTLDRLAHVQAGRVLVFSPGESAAEFSAVAAGRYTLTPQGAGDLGQRLAAFTGQAIAAGAASVVIVGTDSPTLPVAFVEQAFTELERADVVLGPAF